MTPGADDEFRRFVQRRARLNQQLDEARDRIDQWVGQHESGEASPTDLALLEGLLEARRNLLRQLLALDDQFMEHLLELLGKS